MKIQSYTPFVYRAVPKLNNRVSFCSSSMGEFGNINSQETSLIDKFRLYRAARKKDEKQFEYEAMFSKIKSLSKNISQLGALYFNIANTGYILGAKEDFKGYIRSDRLDTVFTFYDFDREIRLPKKMQSVGDSIYSNISFELSEGPRYFTAINRADDTETFLHVYKGKAIFAEINMGKKAVEISKNNQDIYYKEIEIDPETQEKKVVFKVVLSKKHKKSKIMSLNKNNEFDVIEYNKKPDVGKKPVQNIIQKAFKQ